MELNLAEIASVLDAAKGNGYFEDQLSSAFVPFFDKLKSISTDNKPFAMSDIFQINSSKFTNFKKRYEKALNTFIDNFENKVNLQTVASDNKFTTENPKDPPKEVVLAHILPRVLKSLNMGVATPPPLPDDFTTERTGKAMPVHIASVQEGLLEKLGSVSATNVSLSGRDSEKPKGKLGGILKWLAMAGVAVGALAVGAALLFEGFMTDGRLKGTLKMIGTSIFKFGAGILTNLMDNVFKPILKKVGGGLKGIFNFVTGKLPAKGMFKNVIGLLKVGLGKLGKLGKFAGKGARIAFSAIPGLGSIISFGFAYSRFKDGDVVGGMLDIAAGIAPIIPVIGNAVALGIDLFSAYRDLTTTRDQRQNQGKGFFAGIKAWFMNNKFFKGITNLFKGVFGLFTAKNGGDVDDAIDLLKEGGEMLFGPAIGWVIATFDFFRNGGGLKFASKSVDVIKNFGVWYFGLFKKFWGAVLDGMKNIWDIFAQSLFFREIKNTFTKSILRFKLRFSYAVNSITEFINTIPLAIQTAANAVIKKLPWATQQALGVLGLDGFDLDKAGVDTIDTVGIEKALYEALVESDALAKESGERVAKKKYEKEQKALKDRAREETELSNKRHLEMLAANKENAQAITAATLASNDAPDRGDTNIFNGGSSNETTKSLRHTHYVQNYNIPTY
jgi:hypothetical protein